MSGWGVVGDSARCAITANAISSRKHCLFKAGSRLTKNRDSGQIDQSARRSISFHAEVGRSRGHASARLP